MISIETLASDDLLADFKPPDRDDLLAANLNDLSDNGPPASKAETRFGYHNRRARLGVWCCRRADPELYHRLKSWKADLVGEGRFADHAASELARLIRSWQPSLPRNWLITVPPAGASAPGPYPAGFLGRRVGELLDLDFVTMLGRTDAKRYHGSHYAQAQAPFALLLSPLTPVVVVDDMITTAKTMQLSLEALAGSGVPAWGFAFYMYA